MHWSLFVIARVKAQKLEMEPLATHSLFEEKIRPLPLSLPVITLVLKGCPLLFVFAV